LAEQNAKALPSVPNLSENIPTGNWELGSMTGSRLDQEFGGTTNLEVRLGRPVDPALTPWDLSFTRRARERSLWKRQERLQQRAPPGIEKVGGLRGGTG
jgi:hypothetical protein